MSAADECEEPRCARLAAYMVHDKRNVYGDRKVCRVCRLNYPDRTRYVVTKMVEGK